MELYVIKDQQTLGPYSEAEVFQYIQQGVLQTSDLACIVGANEWLRIDQVLNLNSWVEAPNSPPHPSPSPQPQTPVQNIEVEYEDESNSSIVVAIGILIAVIILISGISFFLFFSQKSLPQEGIVNHEWEQKIEKKSLIEKNNVPSQIKCGLCEETLSVYSDSCMKCGHPIIKSIKTYIYNAPLILAAKEEEKKKAFQKEREKVEKDKILQESKEIQKEKAYRIEREEMKKAQEAKEKESRSIRNKELRILHILKSGKIYDDTLLSEVIDYALTLNVVELNYIFDSVSHTKRASDDINFTTVFVKIRNPKTKEIFNSYTIWSDKITGEITKLVFNSEGE